MHISLKKSISVLSLVVLASLQCSLLAMKVAAKDDVVYTWVQSGKLEEERSVFVKGFKVAYKSLTKEQLPIDDLDAFLNGAFDEEVADLAGTTTKVYFLTARKKGKVVGIASFNLEGSDTIYVRQMSIDPDHWKQGIGKALIFKAREVLPQATKYVLMTRQVNRSAIDFYEAIGFKKTSYLHKGLDPKRYVGYEYTIPATSK